MKTKITTTTEVVKTIEIDHKTVLEMLRNSGIINKNEKDPNISIYVETNEEDKEIDCDNPLFVRVHTTETKEK